MSDEGLVFGPVPSRRLGQSLGIANIPSKVCSYSCAYCQVGPTTRFAATRERFFDPAEIVKAVGTRLEELSPLGKRFDYLTFVPAGEPTLDAALGETIGLLSRFGVPIAVITNGSMLWREDVRAEVAGADVVSIKASRC